MPGHPQNERCDQLATTAADGNNLLTDDGSGADPRIDHYYLQKLLGISYDYLLLLNLYFHLDLFMLWYVQWIVI